MVGSSAPSVGSAREIAFLRSCGVWPWNCLAHETYAGKVAMVTANVVIATAMGQACR